MSPKYRIITLIVTLAVGAGIYFYYQFNREVAGFEKKKPDFTLTSDALYDAFESDEENAIAKYNEKIIQVEGEVLSIKQDGMQNNILLKAENALAGGINCSMRDPIEGIEKGQSVVIRGQCQGYLMDVILVNCNVVNE